MRGKERPKTLEACLAGITPAYAGKSYHARYVVIIIRDHPRVCGEKYNRVFQQFNKLGSPPRMRGKGNNGNVQIAQAGITPAYAGKRGQDRKKRNVGEDHPRVCGEKPLYFLLFLVLLGSPPRMRGKGVFQILDCQRIRITPAYAGKRLKRSHRIGHFSCILCLFHSVLHRASASGGSRAGPCAPPCLPAQNAVPV